MPVTDVAVFRPLRVALSAPPPSPPPPPLPTKGGRGISDVSPLSGILRAASLIPLLYISSLVFLYLVLSLFLSYPFLLLVHSPDLFSAKPSFSER